MHERILPAKLSQGDTLRVIAPSWSASIMSESLLADANERLTSMGFTVTYGEHMFETAAFRAASLESRVADIHAAFLDDSVKGIITVIGGWNANQLLEHINWDIIRSHPKVFCGFSDVDTLNNAIYAQTGLVTYSGPHFIFFGQKYHFEYTQSYFQKAVMQNKPYTLESHPTYSDDDWATNQEERVLLPNEGLSVLQTGSAQGEMISCNLSTLEMLKGTPYYPPVNGSILFLEEANLFNPMVVDRNLQALVQQPNFHIQALVFGRFQTKGNMTREDLERIVFLKKQLRGIPIIMNAHYGHADPKATLPTGGTARIDANSHTATIEILEH